MTYFPYTHPGSISCVVMSVVCLESFDNLFTKECIACTWTIKKRPFYYTEVGKKAGFHPWIDQGRIKLGHVL